MEYRPTLTPCYRKCYKCGSTSTNTEESKCKCGNYMHLISQVYAPKTKGVKANG